MSDDPCATAATREDRRMPTLPDYLPSSGNADLDQVFALCEAQGALLSWGPELSPEGRHVLDVAVYLRDGGTDIVSEAEVRQRLTGLGLDLMRQVEDLGWIVDKDSDLRLQVDSARWPTPEEPNGWRLWECRVRLVIKRRYTDV